ncbi:TPA: HEPN domain-containing protein [Serratia marcescens]|nr:HEPN domain-containing protein [Serratia marcescens]
MSVNGNDFIDFANDCMSRNDEIGYRNAIARSYYGVYHHISGILNNGPRESHQGLINYLDTEAWKGNEKFEKNFLRGLAMMLQTMKDKRVMADYDLITTLTITDANESLKTANRIMERCQNAAKTA